MTPLEEVLKGRDERAEAQREMLRGADYVCQISLNVPGWPKRIDGDESAIRDCAEDFIVRQGRRPKDTKRIVNGAGAAELLSFDGDAESAKRTAETIEEETPKGRAFDIDVITKDGPLSRADKGKPKRKCLLCENEAKICARAGAHTVLALRKKLTELLG